MIYIWKYMWMGACLPLITFLTFACAKSHYILLHYNPTCLFLLFKNSLFPKFPCHFYQINNQINNTLFWKKKKIQKHSFHSILDIVFIYIDKYESFTIFYFIITNMNGIYVIHNTCLHCWLFICFWYILVHWKYWFSFDCGKFSYGVWWIFWRIMVFSC